MLSQARRPIDASSHLRPSTSATASSTPLRHLHVPRFQSRRPTPWHVAH